MFSIQNTNLINGGKLWVLKFDPNATSIEQIGLPKAFEYDGRYSPDNGDPAFLGLTDLETNKHFKLNVDIHYNYCETGFYMIDNSKLGIFRRIMNLSNSSKDIRHMARFYVKYLKEEHPEYII